MDKRYEGFDHDAVTYPNFDCGAAIARSFNRRKITKCCWIEEKNKHDMPSDKERREGFLSVWKDNDFELLYLPETPEEKELFRIPDTDKNDLYRRNLHMKTKHIATMFAVLSAALYALNIPLSKLLLSQVAPTMMAAFLYLGAGIGLFCL